MPRRADYQSKALSCAQVRNAIAADAHAKAIGFPLNFTMDVHWNLTRFANWNRRKAVPALLESLRHYLAYHNVGFYSIAVRECPPESEVGEHLHLLVHVPPDLQETLEEHVVKFLGVSRRLRKRAVKAAKTYNDGKLAYIHKGCTPQGRLLLLTLCKDERELQGFLDATKGKHDQGVIYGKRQFIPHSLCEKARRGEKRASRGAVKVKDKPPPLARSAARNAANKA